jgi:hypothetical protein
MSEEPDYSLEIDGHRYEVRGAMLVAERYENFLGYDYPVELHIGPVYKNDVKERLKASLVGVGPHGGIYPVTLAGLRASDLQEIGLLLTEVRRHISIIDRWRRQEYGGG